MPVRNGARYIDQAIQAVLAQDHPDFELLICDNGSTDATAEICGRYLADGRVRYHRFEENVGARQNFNRVFGLATGDLFCWAACDDRMRPGFLRESAGALERNPDAAMCVTPVRFIDAEGGPMGSWGVDAGLESGRLAVRLRSYLHRPGWHMIYNLTRRSVLSETSLYPSFTGGDVILVWSILLRHRVCVVHDALLDYRVTPKTAEGLAATVSPDASPAFYRFGHCQMWLEMWRTVDRTDLSRHDRTVARRALCRWLVSRYWRPLLFRDLYAELRFAAARRRPLRGAVLVAAMFLVRPAHAAAKAALGLREVLSLRRATRAASC